MVSAVVAALTEAGISRTGIPRPQGGAKTMQVHSGTVSNVKTEIVDVATLLGKLKGHANGRAHTNGHGHRPRPQLRDGYRVAALKAHTGASLMNRPGMS